MKYVIFKPCGSDKFVAAKSVEIKASDTPIISFPEDKEITFTVNNAKINTELLKQLAGI